MVVRTIAMFHGPPPSTGSTPMTFDKKETIDRLKFEIEMIEDARYYPAVGDPTHNRELFRDSINCPNVGLTSKQHACSSCFLSQFLPPELRNSQGDICHEIPLDVNGDTIESLKAKDDPYKLQATVLLWLRRTVTQLEAELAAGQEAL
jgi:hypothetical protein